MSRTLDLTKCCRCSAPLPHYDWGIGEWYYPRRERGPWGPYWAERGPYCDMACLEDAKREERL